MDLVFSPPDADADAAASATSIRPVSQAAVTPVDAYWFRPTRDLTGISPLAWGVPCGQSAS